MKSFMITILFLGLGSTSFASDSVTSSQIISRDKVITKLLLDVGPCYAELNSDTHINSYKISFPITVRETGQTWLEFNGTIVPGSFTSFDRVVTSDYSRRMPPSGAVWGTKFEDRVLMCKQIRDSFVTNKDLAGKIFNPEKPE